MMKKQNKKGQSTLEYIIVLTILLAGVIAVVLIIFPSTPGSTGLSKLFSAAGNKIVDESAKLANYVLP
ncbi:MAG: hypothetical protein ABH954_04705 [Candidatus Omnitrophota bacterium]